MEALTAKETGIWKETFYGRPRVVVFGGGHVSLALERVLKTLDLHLTVVDDRPEFASRERFREADEVLCTDFSDMSRLDFGDCAYYVIVTRGHSHDYTCLVQAMKRPHAYIGMIGSRKKVSATFQRLREEGWSEGAIAEIHAPIGLKIGGITPGEIAVSIAAELIQEKNKKEKTVFQEEIAEGLAREKGPLVLAVVLNKTGSSPGKKGCRLLVAENGRTYGTIGGGAVEHAVIQEAAASLGRELFEVREYNLSDVGAASLGMICGGQIRVLLESLPPAEDVGEERDRHWEALQDRR